MYKCHLVRFAMIVGLLVLPMVAQATIVIYEFRDGGLNAPSLIFEEHGLQLTVTGERNNGTPAELVTWNNNGLGVRVNADDDSGALDSIGPNERLIFSVEDVWGQGRGLELLSIDFRWLNQNDGENFSLFVDGTRIVHNFTPSADIWYLPNDLSDPPVAYNELIVSVNDRPADTEARFRIARIGGNTVPAPATLGLLGLPLVSLALKGRKPVR